MPFNLPICLTWMRVIMIPILVAVFYLPASWLSPMACNVIGATLFAIASITDWLDGYLARRLNLT